MVYNIKIREAVSAVKNAGDLAVFEKKKAIFLSQ